MHRSLSKSTATLLATPKPSLPSSSLSSAPRLLTCAASSVPDPDDQSSADPIYRKLEEVIHCIIVCRSAPDWLPFVPGSSYWVSPCRSGDGSLVHVFERLARPVADIKPLSTASARGWPSPNFFIHGYQIKRCEVLQGYCILDGS